MTNLKLVSSDPRAALAQAIARREEIETESHQYAEAIARAEAAVRAVRSRIFDAEELVEKSEERRPMMLEEAFLNNHSPRTEEEVDAAREAIQEEKRKLIPLEKALANLRKRQSDCESRIAAVQVDIDHEIRSIIAPHVETLIGRLQQVTAERDAIASALYVAVAPLASSTTGRDQYRKIVTQAEILTRSVSTFSVEGNAEAKGWQGFIDQLSRDANSVAPQ